MKKPPLLEPLAGQVGEARDYTSLPLELWHPPLCGDIPIRIDAQGVWYHEGAIIRRESLVQLFANILRREEDGEYYLVTPAEKWRITVETHPLLITDFDVVSLDGIGYLQATLNSAARILVSELHPLFLDADLDNIAVLRLAHGLTALCTRPAWYRLVDLAELRGEIVALKSGDFELQIPIA